MSDQVSLESFKEAIEQLRSTVTRLATQGGLASSDGKDRRPDLSKEIAPREKKALGLAPPALGVGPRAKK